MAKDANNIPMGLNISGISSLIEKMEKESNLTLKEEFYTMEILERILSMEKEKRFGLMEALLKEASSRTSKRATGWPT
jgi:hypothetical protein